MIMKTLVCGMPGSGKTTYCKNNLGATGLCYDLDALAAAFRLSAPHEEEHRQARALANELLFSFYTHVGIYSRDVYIIRTAPSIDELKRINPDKVVMCRGQFVNRGGDSDTEKRLVDIERHCLWNNIPFEEA